jgi:hypothetical protein
MFALRKPKALHWTHHARGKMQYYKLSEQRVRRVLHSPKRVEEGIAPKTVAMMQPNVAVSDKREVWKQEIWVMIQDRGSIRTVISAWRYPGMTKPHSEISLGLLRRELGEFYESQEEGEKFVHDTGGARVTSHSEILLRGETGHAAARARMTGMLKKWKRSWKINPKS